MDYGFGLDGKHNSSKPITASEARSLAKVTASNKSKNVNYSLTIRRLYKIISNAIESGADSVTFHTPDFVLDGCIGDPIILARQLKRRLVELGYNVHREHTTLLIDWVDESSFETEKKKKKR